MRWVQRHRRQQRVHLLMEETAGKGAVGLAQLLPAHNADSGRAQLRRQPLFQQAAWSRANWCSQAQTVHALFRRQPALVGALRQAEPLFQTLQHAGHADLEELIQVAGGDGEKLYALQQRDCWRPRPLPARAG
jgi:hypothetical protein